MFTLEISCGNVAESNSDSEVEESEYEMSKPCKSVNALSGSHVFSTMRVKGMVANRALHIMIDSGITHNFLDIHLARNLNCKIDQIQVQQITNADDNHIICQHVVKSFCWQLNGQIFATEVMLIDLGSCDMVLGVQWLSTLGTMRLEFKNLIMEFMHEGHLFKLRGVARKKLKVLKGDCSTNAQKYCSVILFAGEGDFYYI